MLRAHGVVGKFVEFHGPGLSRLGLADRATISNMSPEFGATATLFPVDDETLRYLRMTGRPAETVARVEAYAKEQGLFRTDDSPEPRFNESLSLDLGTRGAVRGRTAPPAGSRAAHRAGGELPRHLRRRPAHPRRRFGARARRAGRHGRDDRRRGLARSRSRPATRRPTRSAPRRTGTGARPARAGGRAPHTNHGDTHYRAVEVDLGDEQVKLRSGSVVIAAITSCTNTSNPSVMVAAGLLARNAVARGLRTPGWVKTSLAPGSRAVTDYLEGAGLMDPLRGAGLRPGRLRLHHLHRQLRPAGRADRGGDRRQRPGRRGGPVRQSQLRGAHPSAGAGQLPRLAAAGGGVRAGRPHRRRPDHRAAGHRRRRRSRSSSTELWPSNEEVATVVAEQVRSEVFTRNYASVFDGDDRWRELPVPAGDRYAWDPDSTYVALPPFFAGLGAEPEPIAGHRGRAGAGHARRQRDHRPHLAGRLDRAHLAGRGVADRARRGAARLQQRTAAAVATTR